MTFVYNLSLIDDLIVSKCLLKRIGFVWCANDNWVFRIFFFASGQIYGCMWDCCLVGDSLALNVYFLFEAFDFGVCLCLQNCEMPTWMFKVSRCYAYENVKFEKSLDSITLFSFSSWINLWFNWCSFRWLSHLILLIRWFVGFKQTPSFRPKGRIICKFCSSLKCFCYLFFFPFNYMLAWAQTMDSGVETKRPCDPHETTMRLLERVSDSK